MQQEQRRLAAILAADVVGYSRLMAADESGTLARLKVLRAEVIDPRISQFHGRVVGSAGDSLLIEFASAVNAVQCAVEIQAGLAERNGGLPEGKRMIFRMGVNLGDVIAEGDTIHGDGVNVAARLEKLAEPGGVCVARSVFEQVEGKLDLAFADLGEHQVKNIAKPIRVYRAATKEQTKPSNGDAKASDARVSIAALPFDNMSGDPEQGYFSDGITEDIITGLSRFRELLVIARNSAFQFRGKTVDIKEVGRKLGVQFVVEGSVRKIGNRVRVTAQLVDAASGAHIWADRYDRELTDVFEIQDEITLTVVTRIAGHARAAVVSRLRARPTESFSAYDNFLQAREYFGSDETAWQAEPFLRKAIDLDPTFSDAHALMSMMLTIIYMHDIQRHRLDDALASGHRALELDAVGALANHAVGYALMLLGRLDEAGHYLRRAMALNPNENYFRGDYAVWLNYTGDTAGALQQIEQALVRDPYANDWFWNARGNIETTAGNYEDALRSLHRMKTPTPWSQCYRAICHVEMGQMPEARTCLEKFRIALPGMVAADYFSVRPYADAAAKKRMVDALAKLEASINRSVDLV